MGLNPPERLISPKVTKFRVKLVAGRAEIKASARQPMEVLNIRGLNFRSPGDPVAVVAVNYGLNWGVPDPFWRFDYRKSKRRFKGATKKLKIR